MPVGLNSNIHQHLLVLAGAYTLVAGRPRFHRARAPTDDDVEHLLHELIRRIVRSFDSTPGRWWRTPMRESTLGP